MLNLGTRRGGTGSAAVAAALATPAATAVNDYRTALSVQDWRFAGGAVGDGVTDDWPAFTEMTTRMKLGGSNLALIPRTAAGYYLSKPWDIRGLPPYCTIDGAGSKIFTSGAQPVIGTWNASNMTPSQALPQSLAAATLSGVKRRSGLGLTLVSGSDANRPLTAGQYVFIFTGDMAVGAGAPMAEYNKLAADTSGTAISLAWPLVHDYRDMGDGNAYAVAVADGHVVIGLTLRNLWFVSPSYRAAALLGMIDCCIDNCRFDGAQGLYIKGRFLRVDMISELIPQWASGLNPIYFGLDTGTSDVIARVLGRSSGHGLVHMHEGVANASLAGRLHQAPTDVNATATWGVVSLKGAPQNITLNDLDIVNCPAGGNVIDSSGSTNYPSLGTTGLHIGRVSITGTATLRAVFHGDLQPPCLVQNLQAGEAQVVTHGFGTVGEPGANPLAVLAAKVTTPDRVVQDAALANTTSTTADGETVWSLLDAAVDGIEAEVNVPEGGWNYVQWEWEVENKDAVVFATGALQAASLTAPTLDAGASGSDSTYVNYYLVMTSGAAKGRMGLISAYVGATKVATCASLGVLPAIGDTYAIWGQATFQMTSGSAGATATEGLANCVWDTSDITTHTRQFHGAGSVRYLRRTDPIGNAARVGSRLRRNGSGASDTLAGTIYARQKGVKARFLRAKELPLEQTRTAAFTVCAHHHRRRFNVTAAVTVTVSSAAALGTGFETFVVANGNAVTLDGPGATNVSMSSGDQAKVYTSGSLVLSDKTTPTVVS